MPIILNRESSSPTLAVDVPRQSSWHVPISSYTGSIQSVKLRNHFAGPNSIPLVRITFKLVSPGSNLDYLAKVDLKLDLTENSDLWNVICRLLGRKALQDCLGGTFDLQQLVGMQCDVAIDHVLTRAEQYAFPYVIVTNVQAAGALVRCSETNLTTS